MARLGAVPFERVVEYVYITIHYAMTVLLFFYVFPFGQDSFIRHLVNIPQSRAAVIVC